MVSKKPLVIVLLGPTASGKTALAIKIAEKFKLSVHNVDSRQIYRGMDIGTAKPTQEERQKVRHHLIDIREPNQPINFKEFQEIAELSLEVELQKNKVPFLVGGSGLYLKALTGGLKAPKVPAQSKLRQQFNELGQHYCHQMLQNCDPIASKRIASADKIRTQRALEVFYATGQTISTQQTAEAPPWRLLELGLDPQNLRERIEKRTESIYANGLIEETDQLQKRFGPELPLLKTIGYKEALKVIQGDSKVSEAIALTTKRTYQFAKRQRTWFRRKHHAQWLNDEEPLREALSLIQAGLG